LIGSLEALLWFGMVLGMTVLQTFMSSATLCDKVCQWLATGRWFSLCTPVSSTNKTDCHDITQILLKVVWKKICSLSRGKCLLINPQNPFGFFILWPLTHTWQYTYNYALNDGRVTKLNIYVWLWCLAPLNISVISWQSVLLVEETGVLGENHRSGASHWQMLRTKSTIVNWFLIFQILYFS
jgi:hypothetical protein